MLEAEVAFVETLDQLMSTVEDGIRTVVEGLVVDGRRRSGRAMEDLRVIEHSLQQDREEKQRNSLPQDDTSAALEVDPISRLRQMTDRPFIRISYTDAVSILQEQHSVTPFEHVPEWGASLQTEHEKYLAGEKFGAPVFVTDYPQTLKPFYMRLNDDTSATATPSPTVACFDLLVPGIGELVGGSLREERLPHLERAISHAGLDKEAYDWYLDLRRYGSVKHGGWGMGWERFVCWVTGVGNIRDVVAFPRWKGNCKY
jgi:asparaginyl-tRNA synthetase